MKKVESVNPCLRLAGTGGWMRVGSFKSLARFLHSAMLRIAPVEMTTKWIPSFAGMTAGEARQKKPKTENNKVSTAKFYMSLSKLVLSSDFLCVFGG